VEDIEIYGWSEAGKKKYFQSNDILSIELEVIESSGLFILVDLNDAVMDAETKFPEEYKEVGEAGWMAFTEEDCGKEEGKWICVLETEVIKSGPDSSVELEILVMDTAGNEAEWLDEPKNVKSGSEGNYKFKLLGLEVEEKPDYWEVKKVSYAPEFIDLDTTGLINTRLSAKVELKSDSATARKIELVGCGSEDEAVGLTRNLLYGGEIVQEHKAISTIVLEFAAFDANDTFGAEIEAIKEETGRFETVEVPYVCMLKIYSQVGNKAIAVAEMQEVNLSASFGFTELGAQDENLDSKIKAEKEVWFMKILGVIGILERIRKYVDMFCKALLILDGVIKLITAVAFALSFYKPAKAAATALCKMGTEGRGTWWEGIYEVLHIPCELFHAAQVVST